METPLILKPGDAVRLRPITPDGEKIVKRDGDIWKVIRLNVHYAYCIGGAGVLVTTGKRSMWIKFGDQNVYIEALSN